MKIKDSFNKVFKDKNRILTVMAHPDDMDLTCGGTVARLISSGKKVRLLVMTNGGKGIKDRTDITEKEFARQRVSEQMEAGLELGIPKQENFNLNIPDGELETRIDNIEKVVFHIREFKPDIVITHNPRHPIIRFSKNYYWVNHRDHRNTGLITIDAMYPYSRDRAFFPQHFKKHKLSYHKVNQLLFVDAYSDPELLYFDVTQFTDKRKKALLRHKGAFTKQDVESLMDEVKVGDNYFEPLGFMEIY